MVFEIKKKVEKQIQNYCKINNLDMNDYLNDLIQKLVTADIYGQVPDFVKLDKIKQEEKAERKSLKEIEKLKKDIEEKNIIINDLNKLVEELKNKKPVEIIKEVVVEKEVIADVPNANGRIYPRAILEREVEKYTQKILERRAYGQPDHPSETTISVKEVPKEITTEKTVVNPPKTPLTYDFSMFNSTTTVYEEEKPIKKSVKPKKRNLK